MYHALNIKKPADMQRTALFIYNYIILKPYQKQDYHIFRTFNSELY